MADSVGGIADADRHGHNVYAAPGREDEQLELAFITVCEQFEAWEIVERVDTEACLGIGQTEACLKA